VIDARVEVVSRALHTFHGRGYCSMGKHEPTSNYYCYDESRAILAALDGQYEPGDYPTASKALTLSARQRRKK
jgi:hypothetical protein